MQDRKTIGDYQLLLKIGDGGNADVWEATDPTGTTVALKVLRAVKASSESYRRFQREVREHSKLTQEQFQGVLPLLAHNLPEHPSKDDPAWLAMPIALPLLDALGNRPRIDEVVAIVASIAETLARLHERGIAHRDVKPANCYMYQEALVISDFGLVDTEHEESAITVGAKALGPRNFIAPEMLMHPESADGRKADVYSLAKTLWSLAAGLPVPPPGEHRPELPGKRLSDWGVNHPRAFYLDRLVEQATREVPADRPNMAEIATALRDWLREPSATETNELSIDDIGNAIADIMERDARSGAARSARQEVANSVAAEIGQRLPTLLEYVAKAKIPYGGIGTDHAGLAEILEPIADKAGTHEVSAYQTIAIFRNTGVGPHAFLRFGAGAVLSPADTVAMAAGYHLTSAAGARIVWSDTDVALLGSPAYDEKVHRLAEGLADNFQAGLRAFLDSLQESR